MMHMIPGKYTLNGCKTVKCKACYLKRDLALNDAYDTWQIHIEWL